MGNTNSKKKYPIEKGEPPLHSKPLLHKKGDKKMNKKKGGDKNKAHTHKNKNQNSINKMQTQFTKMERMNCNPIVDDKTVSKSSCFTNEVLLTLKNSYNKHYPQNAITATDPVQVWWDIKHRMSSCKKEDCWLDVIRDPHEKKKLDKFLFSPDHPKEWNNDPDSWLSNYDINDVLRQYEDKYANFEYIEATPIDFDKKPKSMNGECVRDDLCKFSLADHIRKGKTKIAIVFNLGKHDEAGSHWMAMFIDVQHALLFYLDSASNPTPKEVVLLKDRIIEQGKNMTSQKLKRIDFRYETNGTFEHQKTDSECGMYALYFIITMITHKTSTGKHLDIDELVRYFKSVRIPDKDVFKFRKIYFNTPS